MSFILDGELLALDEFRDDELVTEEELDRQIADLDDIRIIMETQKKIRDQAWTFLLLISDRDLCYVLFPFFHRRSTWI